MSSPTREEIEARWRKLAAEIGALSPPEKLRLAADLLEQRLPDLAHRVASRVVDELATVIAMRGGS